ncbi:MAG: type II toxin-antitoxin system VapC family toxin [Pseudomonadales bacterium]|jgi:predicted nucleic-acid-binding protein|nr:type II toxin-antitoxin system VapC family toxin [Pseudomonadales bacterium]
MAIDTNVLVRLLVSDNAIQSKASHKLFASEDIFIPDTVLLETEWVLRAAFDLTPADICTAFRRVCGLQNVTVSDGTLIAQVIAWHEVGFDFADAFHLALSKDQDTLKTFDANFIKNTKKHTERRVERP